MLLPLLTEYEKSQLSERQPLPDRYLGLSDEEMDRRIAAAKAALGRRVVILGHHYQRDEVIKFADFTGDSYRLAQQIARRPDAEFIVFCGVHFMAESADVLSGPDQQVILPDLAAGCSMADMADIEQLEVCWDDLRRSAQASRSDSWERSARLQPSVSERSARLEPNVNARSARLEPSVDERTARLEPNVNERSARLEPSVNERSARLEPNVNQRSARLEPSVVPVCYINSSAAIKAFCGEHGGVVCTSSNAAATLRWAWNHAERILFLPDQHLGRNTAFRMGLPLDAMAVWDPEEIGGGLDRETFDRARIILWKGHCSVHTRFTARQVENIRARHPGVRVIVHPEVPLEVVQAADDSGSTEYIIKTVTASPEGSVWAVGTEIHLVNRLARQMAPHRTVLSLDQFGCLCSTMFRVSPNHLLWTLETLLDGTVHNRITVPAAEKYWTKIALDRMLTIS